MGCAFAENAETRAVSNCFPGKYSPVHKQAFVHNTIRWRSWGYAGKSGNQRGQHGKAQTLSNDEMMALIDRAQSGDEEARRKLVEGNLKLVLSVIQRFMGRAKPGRPVSGRVHRASEGDRELRHLKQVRFSTYGVPMIAGELRRYLRDYSPIRVSRSVRDTAYRVLQCKQELEKNGREPTMEEDFKGDGCCRWRRLWARWTRSRRPCHFTSPCTRMGRPADGHGSGADTKNTDERWLDSIALRQAIHRLTDRESGSLPCGFTMVGRRWRWPAASASRRRRCRDREKRAQYHPQGDYRIITRRFPAYGRKGIPEGA